jgi:hypothetical protein
MKNVGCAIIMFIGVTGVIASCIILVLSGPAFVNSLFWNTPPASIYNPPIYPNAQQVTVGEQEATMFEKGKRITFQTPDNPDAVYVFYRDTLLADDWMETQSYHGEEPGYATAEFEWYRAGIDSPSRLAILKMNVIVDDTGKSNVTLNLEYYSP